MLGMTILLGFDIIGIILHDALHVPLPANVLGLILFTASLFLKWIKLEWVEESAQFLLGHLMLFFTPVIIGIIVFLPYIGHHLFSIVVSLVATTFTVMLVTGWVTSWMTKEEDKKRHGH